MTPTEVIQWLDNCAESRAAAFGPTDSSTLTALHAANSIRNAMRVFHEAQKQDHDTITHLRDQVNAMSKRVTVEQWESLYESRDAERAKRKVAEAQLAKIVTHIEESAYYGSITAPRGAAKVLHEVLALAQT